MDKQEHSFCFSVGTRFSNMIDKYYYNNIHYLWCAPRFNDPLQPVTSNPLSIFKRYLKIAIQGDRHAHDIEDHFTGILRGAQAQYENGVINKKQQSEIKQCINLARYEDFSPILYIIDITRIDKTRLKLVDTHLRASDDSCEYLITDVSSDECQIIDGASLLNEFVSFYIKKAGE